MAEGADPVITPVSDYMTRGPGGPAARQRLRRRRPPDAGLGIRHLPIVRSGHLVGVLSIRDVLDAEVHHADRSGAG